MKQSQYNQVYSQYKVTLLYVALYPQEIHHKSLQFTSLHFKIKSLYINHVSSPHITSHHFTYLHSIPTSILLLVTTYLTLFLNVFSLQEKDVSKPAGNWFQVLMALFTKEYLQIYVLLFKKILRAQHVLQTASLGATWGDNKKTNFVYLVTSASNNLERHTTSARLHVCTSARMKS